MSLLKEIWRLVLPGPEPTLDLDFTAEALDPRITFTRASTKTYFGADGLLKTALANEWPREFDPITGECLGRSVWEQRTNLLLRSAEFDNGIWTKAGATITANSGAAPDGTVTADTVVENSSSGAHGVLENTSFTAGQTYTLSTFAKQAGRGWAYLQFPSTAFGTTLRGYFNLSAGTIGTVSAGATASITGVGNGYYRVALAAAATTTTTAASAICTATADNQPSHTGDGASGIFLWGAQLEAGAFATPYIPTTTAAVTRSVDVAVVTDASTFGYNGEASTLFVDAQVFGEAGNTNPGIFLGLGTSAANDIFRYAGAFDNRLNVGFLNPNANIAQYHNLTGMRVKVANCYSRYAAERAAIDGVTRTPNLAGSGTVDFTQFNRLGIGNAGRATTLNGQPNAAIRAVRYWPLLLTQAEINGLTG